MSETSAKILAEKSLGIRGALSNSEHPYSIMPNTTILKANKFWHFLLGTVGKQKAWEHSSSLPALLQILPVQDAPFRFLLVQHLSKIQDKTATHALARQAIFDLDPQVREAALIHLRDRPIQDYDSILLESFRYPWVPVAFHAAEAMVVLQRMDLVPQLINLLDQPDPCVPFEKVVNDKKVLMVRELVKINHHKNCLLCHAPAERDRGTRNFASSIPVGPVPVPGEAMPPPSSSVYYAERSGMILVRADITYLRQDFSVMQPVEKADKWPSVQRFDYLVRTRVLSEAEGKKHQERQKTGMPLSDHSRAIIYALEGLTGRVAEAPTALAGTKSGPG